MTSASPTHDTTSDHDRARHLTLVPVFAGIVAALGVVPAITVPGTSVPITAQSLGVMLVGAILGSRRAGASLLLFVALVAIGLPLLAGGRGGLGVFAEPSAGFVLGFPVAAYVVGWSTERVGLPYKVVPGIVANLLGGVAVLYLFGILGIALRAGISVPDATVAVWVFVPGDVAKAVIAALVARGVHAAYPGLIPTRRSARTEVTAA